MHAMIYICWLADRLIAASIIWKTNHNLAFTQTSKAKLEFWQRRFAFQGALVYNTLHRHLRHLNSRLLFKRNLKEFFQ